MSLSILIHTFNGYQHFWEGCLDGWSKHAPYSIPRYLGTDTKDHRPHEANFLYSGEGEWSDRLVKLLEQVPSEYVLYAQEDHWPTASPPDLYMMMEVVKKHDLFRLQLSPIIQFYSLSGSKVPYFFHTSSKYLVSHQPSIWKKTFLMECLRPKESPWVNEYKGTLRLNNRINNKIALYPCDWYSHKCIKGKFVE